MKNTALILLAHGSKNNLAEQEMLVLVDKIKNHKYISEKEISIVRHAFIQFCKPFLEDVLQELVEDGYKYFYIVPLFVFSGSHILTDVPSIINDFIKKHPHIVIETGEHLGAGDYLVDFSVQSLQRSVKID